MSVWSGFDLILTAAFAIYGVEWFRGKCFGDFMDSRGLYRDGYARCVTGSLASVRRNPSGRCQWLVI